nr:RyR domain-containing protein [uncultured Oscillibacter sp.]
MAEQKAFKVWGRHEMASKLILFCVPLALGMFGFHLAGNLRTADALYACVCMYILGYQTTPPNIWVELARWTAPLATLGAAVTLLTALQVRVRNLLCYLRGRSVAVYGPEEERRELLEALGGSGIEGRDRFVRARSYVLLNPEEENFRFCGLNRQRLQDCRVYLKCRSLPAEFAAGENLHLFCPEEAAARLFWKKRRLYETLLRRGKRLNVVLLGFGILGEEVLRYGLLHNIFDPGQRIEYHIFGDGGGFAATHTQLSSMGDPVIFHEEPWYERTALLEDAAALLVLTQEDQLRLVRSLLLAVRAPEIDVFAAGDAGAKLLEGQKRLTVFSWQREAQRPEHILQNTLFARAKRLNLHYVRLSGRPDEGIDREWRKLDAFTRYSNVSAADYHDIRLQMLDAWGCAEEALPPDTLERLAELEHIRWCRYHYLHNWKHGVPTNGRRKDPVRREHVDLCPYEELEESEKEKDRRNVLTLLELDDGGREGEER